MLNSDIGQPSLSAGYLTRTWRRGRTQVTGFDRPRGTRIQRNEQKGDRKRLGVAPGMLNDAHRYQLASGFVCGRWVLSTYKDAWRGSQTGRLHRYRRPGPTRWYTRYQNQCWP